MGSFTDKLPIDSEKRKSFFAEHVFHERQMNSCPIGCKGCAVSASTTNKGSIAFNELAKFYEEAKNLDVSLKITKVEGYDPAFVNYSDDKNIPFAQSITAAIDNGHSIITPVCTTGSWRNERSKWQMEELGKLPNKYRKYTYPSGRTGEHFVLSVPREITQFSNNKYHYDEHIEKIVRDIRMLTVGGNIEVLIYYNSHIDGDLEFAERIRDTVSSFLTEDQRNKADLIIANFNEATLPESCMRYENSILLHDSGFDYIDPVNLEWKHEAAPNLVSMS